jgi:hypothetical protein
MTITSTQRDDANRRLYEQMLQVTEREENFAVVLNAITLLLADYMGRFRPQDRERMTNAFCNGVLNKLKRHDMAPGEGLDQKLN